MMAERWEPTLSDTLPSDIRLLSLVDDCEGFRILLQDPKSLYVYGIYADVVFYRRSGEHAGGYAGEPVPQVGVGRALVYRVRDSELVKSLRPTFISGFHDESLQHYALCFKYEERIDIVCRGEAEVRGADRHHGDLVAKA